jgi:NAD(P)H dehydrogenase (quinone)
MTTFAVTAATGQLGRLVIAGLLKAGVTPADVVAVVRDHAKGSDFAELGVQVRAGDYNEPQALSAALTGVDKLLLISGSEVGQRIPQHQNVIDAAKAAGVQRIAYTSVLRADETGLVLAPEHKATEEAIAASGISYTFLRHGWYTENYTAQLGQYLAHGVILHAAGEGRIAAATRADFAAADVAALLEDRADNVVYELAGPAFTYADLARTITAVTGTPVEAKALGAEELQNALTGAGLDAGLVGFLVAVDGNIAAGELDGGSQELEKLLGRPATPLAEAVTAAQ